MSKVLAEYDRVSGTVASLRMRTEPLDKDIRIGAGVDLAHAMKCLADFLENYKESHVGYGHPVLYGIVEGRSVRVPNDDPVCRAQELWWR